MTEASEKPWVVKTSDQSVEVGWRKTERKGTLWALQIEKNEAWETIYRGYGKSAVIDNLSPSSHYRVRLAEVKEDGSLVPHQPIYFATKGTPKTLEDLFDAIEKGADVTVEHILDHEVLNIDCVNSYGLNPLMMASEFGNMKIVQLLLDHKADPRATGINGRNSLMLACHEGHLDIITKLVEAGCRWDDTDVNGNTPLHLAVEGGQPRVVSLALRSGAPVDSRDQLRKWTPLMKCIVLGRGLEISSLLIRHGADVNLADRNGMTPLMLAALSTEEDSLSMVRLLVKAGANVFHINPVGQTALDLAISKENKPVCQYLKDFTDKFHHLKEREATE